MTVFAYFSLAQSPIDVYKFFVQGDSKRNFFNSIYEHTSQAHTSQKLFWTAISPFWFFEVFVNVVLFSVFSPFQI